MRRTAWGLAAVVLLPGCVIRTVVVHDGLTTTVVDAASRQPLAQAFAYDQVASNDKPVVLALSNTQGELQLEGRRRLTVTPLLGEAIVFRQLWVCKEGYTPRLVGVSSGWNSDYGPTRAYTPQVVELVPSPLPAAASCSAPAFACAIVNLPGCAALP
ncbi:MAG: hypothetical protein RLZZ618_2051 [Pseudomonadota bacterium]|jgi:hypothetical protein